MKWEAESWQRGVRRKRERERGRQASWRQRSHLSHPIYLIQRLLKTAALFLSRKMSRKQNKQNTKYRRAMRGERREGVEFEGEGLSDVFALSKSCQGDVISLRPTMKVISQSKGISREPWLLQRPATLGPMTLFMCAVRQSYPEGNLNGLWFFFPFSLPAYNPCASLAICTAKCKTEGSKRRDSGQILYCKRVSLRWRVHGDTFPCSCRNLGCKTFLISMHLFRSKNRNFWVL